MKGGDFGVLVFDAKFLCKSVKKFFDFGL